MGRSVNKLTAMMVAKSKEPGYHGDGAGLYLQISPSGSKSWIFKYTRNGKPREMGLGSVNAFSLAEARELATAQRKLVFLGKDPIDERNAMKMAGRLLDAKRITFAEAAKQYIEAHRGEWTSDRHAEQWVQTLDTYCQEKIGSFPVGAIDTGHVLSCLEPIWSGKTETATRLRGRIEKVLDWATTRGYRAGENPARWKGHLEHSLAAPKKIKTKEHHPALPYAEIGAFMKRLREYDDFSIRILEFTILNATRSSESRLATWAEIDFDAKIWSIPAGRMKLKKEHRVPLASRSLEILQWAKDNFGSDPGAFVFPGKRGKPLPRGVFGAALKRLEREDLTTHGFRSTYRDWSAEVTNHDHKVCEKVLAHQVGDETERAYQRGDLLEKRRMIMEDWANFCSIERTGGVVVPMQRSKAAA